MKYFVFGVLFFASSFFLYSQENKSGRLCRITGCVIDTISQQTIEYATVAIFPEGSTKPLNGTYTDGKGFFSIEKLPAGKYKLTINFIGYNSKIINNILVAEDQQNIALGNITLNISSQMLEGVTVTGNKSLVENHVDKITFNVDRDITSQGGLAMDVLKKIPLVSVDVDGTVQLQGSSNINVLIDGKPSAIFGNSLADALQAIPASQIKSIEVITSPGAKYDAEGTGGIINIILKQNKSKGVSGNVTFSAGTRLENGSANLNVKNGSFGLNASLSGNSQLSSTSLNSLDRSSIDSIGNAVRLTQNGQSSITRNNYKAQIGFDWDITKKNNLSGSAIFNNLENKNDGYSNQLNRTNFLNTARSIDSTSNTVRNFNTQNNYPSLESYLDYKKLFNTEGQELDVSLQSSVGKTNASYNQNQLFSDNDSLYSGAKSSNIVKDNETILQIDFSQPLKNEAKLELGTKFTYSLIKSTSDFNGLNTLTRQYEFDSTQLNDFTYKRQIYAVYGTISFKIFQSYNIKVGGRFERTSISANFPKLQTKVIPSYNFFIPSITISKSLAHGKIIKISYSQRIKRPDYKNLNPFLDASDPSNINTGNPGLKPEHVHYGEIGFSKSFERGGSFIASIYGRYNLDDLQNYSYYYPTFKIGDSVYNNVTINTTENIGVQKIAGLNVYGNAPVTTKLTLRGNFMFYYLNIKDISLKSSSTSSINYRINITATYQYNENLAMEFFGNFRSPMRDIQGSSKAFITYSFALKKLIYKKKISIGITATNPFNKYVDLETTQTGQNFTLVNDRKIPYRSFGLVFSYNFGKFEFKKTNEYENDENN